MKKLIIFFVVGGLHIVVFGALFIHAGCQSKGAVSESSNQGARNTVTATSMTDEEVAREFNALPVSQKTDSNEPELFPPTRPKLVMEMEPMGARVPIETIPAGEVLSPSKNSQPVLIENAPVQGDQLVDNTIYEEYVVKSGDSLWVVAKRFGLSHKELAKLNNINADKGLQIGQVLQVPIQESDLNNKVLDSQVATNTAAAPASSIEGTEYVVQRGDNLTKIAKRYGTTIKAIKTLSNLKTDNLRIGQKLTIPQMNSNSSERLPNSASSTTNTVSSQVTHIVKKGEYLSTIAKRYNVPVKELVRLNRLKNANSIRIGQQLLIKEEALAKNEEPVLPPGTSAVTNNTEKSVDEANSAPELILPTPTNILETTVQEEVDPLDEIEQNSSPVIIRRNTEN